MVNLARLREYPTVAIDVETTGKYWFKDKIFGAALAVHDGEHVHSAYWDVREQPRILDALRRELPLCGRVVNHHIKFDANFLMNENIELPLDRIECTMTRAALINEHEIMDGDGYNLDAIASKCIGEGKANIWAELAQLFGGAPTKAAQIKNLHRAPSSLAAKYAAPDPALALKLWLWQEKEIERQGLSRIWSLERQVTPILIQIERQGIRVDVERAEAAKIDVEKAAAGAKATLRKIAGGKDINPGSTPQLRDLFGVNSKKDEHGRTRWFTKEGEALESTDAGGACLDKDALMGLVARNDDPRAKAILAYRRMDRAGVFLRNHILGHAHKGRVYPNYNQTKSESGAGVGPGRLSMDDPAMQQIPMHDRDVAEIVRPCFLPEEGHDWVSCDWKQFEFRWFAHYTKDPNILKMYQDDPNADFHQTVADITGITRDRKFAGDTANAKQINLGLVFGMGEGEMAYNMGMEFTLRVDKNLREWKEAGPKAKEIFRKYHDAIPGVRALLQQASSIARARGYVETIHGRHIRFPGGKYVHKAGGLVFQGTSADCMKLKLIEMWNLCKKEGWRYILPVHDEHDVSTPKSKTKKSVPVMRKVLEAFRKGDPIECRVPILSDIAFGDNWWEACK